MTLTFRHSVKVILPATILLAIVILIQGAIKTSSYESLLHGERTPTYNLTLWKRASSPLNKLNSQSKTSFSLYQLFSFLRRRTSAFKTGKQESTPPVDLKGCGDQCAWPRRQVEVERENPLARQTNLKKDPLFTCFGGKCRLKPWSRDKMDTLNTEVDIDLSTHSSPVIRQGHLNKQISIPTTHHSTSGEVVGGGGGGGGGGDSSGSSQRRRRTNINTDTSPFFFNFDTIHPKSPESALQSDFLNRILYPSYESSLPSTSKAKGLKIKKWETISKSQSHSSSSPRSSEYYSTTSESSSPRKKNSDDNGKLKAVAIEEQEDKGKGG